jgi:hypothetical protein
VHGVHQGKTSHTFNDDNNNNNNNNNNNKSSSIRSSSSRPTEKVGSKAGEEHENVGPSRWV